MAPADISVEQAEQLAAELKPYAAALKLEPIAPRPPLTDDEAKRDAKLISSGFEEYVKNRPGPESFPGMALQVITMLGRPDASIDKLATLVAREPGLTATLLRVVNSAAYRGVRRMQSVREAITRLGLNEAGRVIGAAAAKVLFDARSRASTLPFVGDFEMLYINAVTTAVTAGAIAARRPPARTDRCYLGGLLHDIGRSVALRALATLRERGSSELVPKSPQTYRVLESLHVPIGSDVLKAWQLPEFVIEMANSHHASGLTSGESNPELHIVALASALQLLRSAPAMHPGAASDLLVSAKALGLDAAAVKAIDLERTRFEGLARALSSQ